MLRKVKPEWQAVLGVMLFVPAVSHSMEFTIHYAAARPCGPKHFRVDLFYADFESVQPLCHAQGALIVGVGARRWAKTCAAFPRSSAVSCWSCRAWLAAPWPKRCATKEPD